MRSTQGLIDARQLNLKHLFNIVDTFSLMVSPIKTTKIEQTTTNISSVTPQTANSVLASAQRELKLLPNEAGGGDLGCGVAAGRTVRAGDGSGKRGLLFDMRGGR